MKTWEVTHRAFGKRGREGRAGRLSCELPTRQYDVEVNDGGADVPVKKTNRGPEFTLAFVGSDVRGTRVDVEREYRILRNANAPQASWTAGLADATEMQFRHFS